ncbi:MAG: GGDEF domain-containing protein [Sulfuriflexus sp.]|nr:GGDEF domain-containing protein [Sulfuriflexus sp.]
MIRVVIPLLIPVSLLILAALLYPKLAQPIFSASAVTPLLPFIIGVPALALCLQFNRSRYFFSLFSILLSYLLLHWFLAKGQAGLNAASYQAMALLLPINLLVFSLIRERGMLTAWGSSRFILIFIQVAFVFLMYTFYPASLTNIIDYEFINATTTRWTHLPQPALLIILVVVLILNGKLFATPSTAAAVSFCSFIASLVMLHFHLNENMVIAFATATSTMFAIAIIQESHRMAYIDQLTSLPGRRALNEQTLKLSNKYSIAMVDIDKFKKFNDTYGHDIGDQVLRMVASKLANTGSGGKAFRYGGEEFCIIFAGQDINVTMKALEDLRETIANSHFDLRKQNRRAADTKRKTKTKNTVQVTISIGVSQRSDKLSSPHAVIKAADKALYRAKQKGRNRVCK